MRRVLVLIATAVALGGCEKHQSSSEQGASLVTFNGEPVISVEEVQHQLSEQSPFIRARYQSLEKRKELVDGMIRLELLAREARREGYDQDDEALEEYKKSMVQQLMRKKFNEKEGMAQLTDADLLAYYDTHKDEYQRPEKLRLQVIFFKIDSPDKAAKVKAEATSEQKALAAALQKQNITAFADRARARSDDPVSKIKGGDIDFHTHEELAKLYSDSFASAADALKTATDVSPVIEGPNGLYLLRLESRQPAFDRSFEQVKENIRSRVWNERRNQNFDEFVKKLREQANIKIDDAALAKIDATKPDLSVTTKPVGPPPMARPPVVGRAANTPASPLPPAPSKP